MNTDILPLLQPYFDKFNIAQKALATQILSDRRYLIGTSQNGVVIRDIDGNVYPFFEFIKSKCNCN
jgi:hypothetical protein